MTRITLLETEPAAPAGTVYRALRADVDFPFAEIADGPEYEAVREDGTPDREGGVVPINPFEVPPEADDAFLAGWDRARAMLAEQQGYLGTRLHRSTDAAARFRFVNVARWSSPLMVQRALQRPEFQSAATAMPFPSHPALYLPVG
jgi:heme oxygenase (mycobilin-producing)